MHSIQTHPDMCVSINTVQVFALPFYWLKSQCRRRNKTQAFSTKCHSQWHYTPVRKQATHQCMVHLKVIVLKLVFLREKNTVMVSFDRMGCYNKRQLINPTYHCLLMSQRYLCFNLISPYPSFFDTWVILHNKSSIISEEKNSHWQTPLPSVLVAKKNI